MAEPDPRLTVSAVAEEIGVSVATLRTWERRYQVGASAHQPGRHRLYTARDVARLRRMRQLIAQGITAAEAARVADGAHDSRPEPRPRKDPGAASVGPAVVRTLVNASLALDAAAVRRS